MMMTDVAETLRLAGEIIEFLQSKEADISRQIAALKAAAAVLEAEHQEAKGYCALAHEVITTLREKDQP